MAVESQSAMRRPSREVHEDLSAIFIRVIVSALHNSAFTVKLALIARRIVLPSIIARHSYRSHVSCSLDPSHRCNPLSSASHLFCSARRVYTSQPARSCLVPCPIDTHTSLAVSRLGSKVTSCCPTFARVDLWAISLLGRVGTRCVDEDHCSSKASRPP